jgi:rod shape determining protein RodA
VTFGGLARTRARASLWRGWDRFDYVMVGTVLALVGVGLALIHSGSRPWYDGPMTSLSSPVARQALYAAIGIAVMLAISRVDYHRFVHFAWLLYGLSILSLVALFVLGHTVHGSTRWFDLGPIQVQPSEFAKVAAILCLARFFAEREGDARDVRTLLLSLGIVAPLAGLVFIQPDLGTSVVFGGIWLGIVVIAGANRSHLLMMGAVFVAVLPFVWTFAIQDYQVERVAVLVDPYEDPLDAGFTVLQSQIALGSGQLFGKGFMQGEQTQLEFLRVATKDFIFSLLGEEFGFTGAMVLFALFILLLMRGVRAAQLAGDQSGQLIAVGLTMLILVQAFIHLAVNVSMFPVTGIPLPFVSQGGSSLVSLFAALGLLQSIVMRHRSYRQT